MFTVHYCAYQAQNPDHDTIFRPLGSKDYLFLLLLSPMNFYFEKETLTSKSGTCLLYTPGTPQHYQAIQSFQNSYIHFQCEDEDLADKNLLYNQLFTPSNTSRINTLIHSLDKEYRSKLPYFEQSMDLYMKQLIIELSRDQIGIRENPQVSQDLYLRFCNLRYQMLTYCEHDWNIREICGMVNLSKSQFYEHYKQFFHTTPKAELISARIDKAKNLLTNEAMQVKEVAALSGFQNIYHFSRYFKEICGYSPGQYAEIERKHQSTC